MQHDWLPFPQAMVGDAQPEMDLSVLCPAMVVCISLHGMLQPWLPMGRIHCSSIDVDLPMHMHKIIC